MKTLLQVIGMAVILFFYGYLLSTAGHDHSAHQHGKPDSSMEKSIHPHDDGHEHSHH